MMVQWLRIHFAMQGASILGQGTVILHAAGQLNSHAYSKDPEHPPQNFCNKKHIHLSMLCSLNPSSIQLLHHNPYHVLTLAPPTTDCWLAPSNLAST